MRPGAALSFSSHAVIVHALPFRRGIQDFRHSNVCAIVYPFRPLLEGRGGASRSLPYRVHGVHPLPFRICPESCQPGTALKILPCICWARVRTSNGVQLASEDGEEISSASPAPTAAEMFAWDPQDDGHVAICSGTVDQEMARAQTEEEGSGGSSQNDSSAESMRKKRRTHLMNRIVFGTLFGAGAISSIVAGGWFFAVPMAAIILVGAYEYFGLMEARAKVRGEMQLPLLAVRACCAMCTAMPLMTMYYRGRIGWAVATASVLLLVLFLLQPTRPRQKQFNSVIFALFYCGYLPSFWIKLRSGLPDWLPSPLLSSAIARHWPAALGSPSQWSIGLIATFLSFATIIAADTGAYLGGKSLGRAKLIDISPQKTREGALAGLLSAMLMAVGLSLVFKWPSSTFSAATLAVLIFMASLFGDLTESMLKRDARVKDSGQLIPGHGGILDRTDSYIFTGALVYSFVKIGIPVFGL